MARNKGKMRANAVLDDVQEHTDGQHQEEALSNQQRRLVPPNSNPLESFTPALSPVNKLASVSHAWGKLRNFNRGNRMANPRPELSQIEEGRSYQLSKHQPNYEEYDPPQRSLKSHPPQNSSQDQRSGDFFKESREVTITGGGFNHIYGDVAIYVDSHSEGDTAQQFSSATLASPPSRTPIYNPMPQHTQGVLPMPIHEQGPESLSIPNIASPLAQDIHHAPFPPVATYDQGPSTSTTVYFPDNSNKIYERHLELKKKGFPLWIPEPNMNLPVDYRRKGVNIGDVGIITPSGAFSFLFNICFPHNDPINPPTLPDSFVPIDPPIQSTDIRKFPEFKRNNYLASATIKTTKTHDDPPFRGLSFETSSTEGAIITFPEGAVTYELANVSRFRKYTKANIEEWYRYVNGPLGCEANNGDIRLVIGCVKATSWGLATVTNLSQGQETHYLKYCSVEDGGVTNAPIPLYKWEYTGLADAKVGPDLEEIEDLKRNDDSDMAAGGKYQNQCLFVSTLNPMLSDDVFKATSQELESAQIQDSQQVQKGAGDYSSSSTPPNPDAMADSNGIGMGSAIRTGSTSESLEATMEKLAVDNIESDSEHVVISKSPNASKLHPADVLNKLLLQKVPNSRVVITEDENWCSIIEEDDEVMPNLSEVAERVLATHHIRNENGAVFLERKDTHFLCTVLGCNSTFTRQANLKDHLLSHDECKCEGCREQSTRTDASDVIVEGDSNEHQGFHSATFRPRSTVSSVSSVDTFKKRIVVWDDKTSVGQRHMWTFTKDKDVPLEDSNNRQGDGSKAPSGVSTLFSLRLGTSTGAELSSKGSRMFFDTSKGKETSGKEKVFRKDKASKEPWRGMALDSEEIWCNGAFGRFKVSRKNAISNDPGKPPQQRLNITLLHTRYTHDGTQSDQYLDGPAFTIHKHSTAGAFSIARHFRNKLPVEPNTTSSLQSRTGWALIFLGSRRVQYAYTSTTTTRKLESHGLLDKSGRTGSRDVERIRREYEREESAGAKAKEEKDKSIEKEKDRAKETEKERSRQKLAETLGSKSVGSKDDTQSEPTQPLFISLAASSAESVSSINYGFSSDGDSIALTPITTPDHSPSREAYASLPPEVFETNRQEHSSHGFFGWDKSKGGGRRKNSSINPYLEQSYNPPWTLLRPNSEIGEIKDSNRRQQKRRHNRGHKQPKSAKGPTSQAHPDIFEGYPPDALFMLLPLWPEETDLVSARMHPFIPTPIPVHNRQYLLVYYKTFEDSGKTKSAETKRSRGSPSNSGYHNRNVLLSAFYISARIVAYRDFQGSGVRIPDLGLAVSGRLEDAYATMPSVLSLDDYVIGICHSRENGIEFVPEGFDKLGLTTHISEDNHSSDSLTVLTPIGRAVMEIVWLGGMALTSFPVPQPHSGTTSRRFVELLPSAHSENFQKVSRVLQLAVNRASGFSRGRA